MMEIEVSINGRPIRRFKCHNMGEKQSVAGFYDTHERTRYDVVFDDYETGETLEKEVWHRREDGANVLTMLAAETFRMYDRDDE